MIPVLSIVYKIIPMLKSIVYAAQYAMVGERTRTATTSVLIRSAMGTPAGENALEKHHSHATWTTMIRVTAGASGLHLRSAKKDKTALENAPFHGIITLLTQRGSTSLTGSRRYAGQSATILVIALTSLGIRHAAGGG